MAGRWVAPEPYGSLIDRVNARDQAYFKAHPTERFWYRAIIPGEFWPGRYETATLVEVEAIVPGVLVRRPLAVPP